MAVARHEARIRPLHARLVVGTLDVEAYLLELVNGRARVEIHVILLALHPFVVLSFAPAPLGRIGGTEEEVGLAVEGRQLHLEPPVLGDALVGGHLLPVSRYQFGMQLHILVTLEVLARHDIVPVAAGRAVFLLPASLTVGA